MISPSRINHGSAQFRMLSQDQLFEMRQAVFLVLEKTGCRMTQPEAVKLLKEAGAEVKDDRVRIPRHVTQECLRRAPKGIMIYNRDGELALELEGRKSYFGSSTGSPFTRDIETGEMRPTLLQDIRNGARIADGLEHIEWVMPMGSATDCDPPLAEEVFEFEAVVTNTTKPVVMLSYSQAAFEAVYEMASAVAGGEDELRAKPFVIAYPESISPLQVPDEVVNRILFAAGLGMPIIPGPVAQLGATGPVTIAGAAVQELVESLFMLCIAQLKRPGTPCFLSGSVAGFDMAAGNISVGGPEISLGHAISSEVAQSLGLPTWGTAGCTDSKLIDAQAGAEGALGILAQALAGINMIHDVGYMDASMACSQEMMVLGDEYIGWARRFIQGVEVSAETICAELIDSVGPGGSYIQQRHTFDNFRKELWFPTLPTRLRHEAWLAEGGHDMAHRVRAKTLDLLNNHQPKALADDKAAAVADIKNRLCRELAD